MRGKYQKYDLSSKTKLVEAFTEQELTDGVSMRKFAAENDIAYSTFKHWVVQYRQYMAEEEKKGHAVSLPDTSGFIMISEERSDEVLPDNSYQGIRLRYKDAVLEFDSVQLEQVMEILKRW